MKSLRSITGPLSPIHLLTPFVFLLLTSSPLVQHHTASAQANYIPITVSAPAVARTQTKLYILGGTAYNTISQFMYLDLSVGWTTAAPAWTRLANGPAQSHFPAAFISDEQTMFVFHLSDSNKPAQYNVQTNTWSVTNYTFNNKEQSGVNVVTDPNTGLMYLPGGYSSYNFDMITNAFTKLDTFDPLTLTVRQTNMPTSLDVFTVRAFYGNVWSQVIKAVLYFGGYHYQPGANVVTAFKPATMSFFTLNASGTAPPMRRDHCMAANEDGSKVLIYGGRLESSTATNDVFVLDVVGQTWTQGVSSSQSRMYTACTVAGDQLLIWGGVTGDGSTDVAPAEMLIYDYVKMIWTTQYTPPKPTPSSNTGAVIAGVVSGSVLVAAVVGIFFFRRRRSRRKDRRAFVKALSDGPEEAKGHAIAAASLGPGSGSRHPDNLAKDPMESNEEYELERTLMDLEEQKRELEMKQQLLVLQHHANNPEHDLQDAVAKVHRRGPTAYIEPEAEYFPVQPPTYPDHQQRQQGVPSPGTSYTAGTTFSYRDSAWSSPTAEARVVSPTYAATSPSSSLSGPSYISPSSIVRTSTNRDIQGGLVQLEPEPSYGLTPGFVPGTPDLVYGQMTGSGRQWVRKARGPQIVVDPEDGTVRIP